MRKFILFALCALMGVFVTGTLSSCERLHHSVDENSTTVKVEPLEFATVNEVLVFQLDKQNQKLYDSIFCNMPTEVLTNVSKVCLDKKPATQEDICKEYLAHKNIYDVLVVPPDNNKNSNNNDTVHLSVNAKDTIIDGKRYQLVQYNQLK